MHDQDLYFHVLKYLEKNGLDYDSEKVTIIQGTDEIIKIGKWEYDIKQPELSDLSYSEEEIDQIKKEENTMLNCNTEISVVLSLDEIKTPREKMFVFCTGDFTLNVYSLGSWISFKSV